MIIKILHLQQQRGGNAVLSPVNQPSPSAFPASAAPAKSWGRPRTVVIQREEGAGLGISIVGGKARRLQCLVRPTISRRVAYQFQTDPSGDSPSGGGGDMVAGIFIKHVLPDSPAGRASGLFTGDRVLEIGGVRLAGSDHRAAVAAIRAAGNPVSFVVQSLEAAADSPSSQAATPVAPSPPEMNQVQQKQELLSPQAGLSDGAEGKPSTPPGSPEVIQVKNILHFSLL